MEHNPEVANSFAAWLYRPYLDLGEREADGNYHTLGLELASKALCEGRNDYARVHVALYPSARRLLVTRVGHPRHLAEDPTDLPAELRTAAWQSLCDHLDAFDDLDGNARLRVLWLLHQLCLSSAILVHDQRDYTRGAAKLSDEDAALLHMRGFTKVHLFRDGAIPLDLTDLQRIEDLARPGSWAHVEATYVLAQTALKSLNDLAKFSGHLDRHRRSIDAAQGGDHERNKLLSRYHRIFAMGPQLTGDLTEMSREMDLAQRHCDLMLRDDENTTAEWQILQAGILESRIKERLVWGDLDGADRYARTLVSRYPSDPRARLELGQVLVEKGELDGAVDAYRWASIVGPHVAQIAEFMMGQCFEHMGRAGDARASYLRSLETDPLAISAIQRLCNGGLATENPQLASWAVRHLASLQEHESPNEDQLDAYQEYAGLLGGGA
ncbi:hypothetical protein ACH4UM_13030 [Streptomyces sp. NPDC020801]|uniref:hypothetical protein n=1 Tax=unclassified Streptomyces TaxID=2593676 RepID=UPI0037B245EF